MADGFFWDGYLHWARDIEEKDPELGHRPGDGAGGGSADLFEPIFIRLELPFERDLFEALRSFFEDDLATARPARRREMLKAWAPVRFLAEYAFDPLEPAIGFAHALKEEAPPEFFVYRPVARTPADHEKGSGLFTVLDVGAPASVNPDADVFEIEIPPSFRAPDVFGAVIDNDIGFLNRAFRDGAGRTRFAAIWLQARERLGPDLIPGIARMTIGEALDGRAIDDLARRYGRNERQAYAAVNATLHSRAAFRLPPPIAAHGSMVADLAFGNGALDGRDVPLLAVQLPPEAARDTSGTTSESYIVQGVRWICYWARKLDPDVPVVINLSYGVLAGQKDGGKFIEAQIAREIELAKLYPGFDAAGQDVEVVFAFGNGRNARQVADVTVAPGAPQELAWLVPGDNAAPAFVEVRAVDGDAMSDLPSTIGVTLIAPDGTAVSAAGTSRRGAIGAEPPVTATGGTVPARLYVVPPRDFEAPPCRPRPSQPGYVLAAIAPTRARGRALPVALPGDWIVKLENGGDRPVRVILQVQRGDTAPGVRGARRQSRFGGALVPQIVDGIAGYTVAPPLTNAGTNSAFTNVPAFHTAGAGRDVFGRQTDAPYSAQGADWTTEAGPDDVKTVDRAFTRGLRAGGAYSGTHARLSGTSAAAALRARELARTVRSR
jgi:hypothetical protein